MCMQILFSNSDSDCETSTPRAIQKMKKTKRKWKQKSVFLRIYFFIRLFLCLYCLWFSIRRKFLLFVSILAGLYIIAKLEIKGNSSSALLELAGLRWTPKKGETVLCIFSPLFYTFFFLFFAKIGRHTTTKRKNKHTHANYFFSLPPNRPKPELLLRV